MSSPLRPPLPPKDEGGVTSSGSAGRTAPPARRLALCALHHRRNGHVITAIDKSSPASAGIMARPAIQARSISSAGNSPKARSAPWTGAHSSSGSTLLRRLAVSPSTRNGPDALDYGTLLPFISANAQGSRERPRGIGKRRCRVSDRFRGRCSGQRDREFLSAPRERLQTPEVPATACPRTMCRGAQETLRSSRRAE
jgi:hypothetical protein